MTDATHVSAPCGTLPCETGAVSIPGPAGGLEGLVTCPADPAAFPMVAVICHPHPLHGGSMQNKVVHTLARGFNELGLYTVRFNFRGVDQSHGNYDGGIGETGDLLAVADWTLNHCPNAELWFSGFSFGAYVALRAAALRAVARVILVAPPVNLYDFTALPSPGRNCLVLQGDQDEVVAAPGVRDWVARMDPPAELVLIRGAGHFFHRQLNDLRAALVGMLGPQM
ncbi:MAG: alpha/beta hydrolase [Acidiferrobacterales bacterium]